MPAARVEPLMTIGAPDALAHEFGKQHWIARVAGVSAERCHHGYRFTSGNALAQPFCSTLCSVASGSSLGCHVFHYLGMVGLLPLVHETNYYRLAMKPPM